MAQSLRTVWNPERKADWIRRTLGEIESARAAFEAGDAPYGGPDALLRLRARLDQMTSDLALGSQQASRAKPQVYISYRRSDSQGYAGRLFDELVGAPGKENVMIDIDSIALGSDFRDTLFDRVTGASVVLALIGPEWLGTRDEGGRRRIDAPNDFVRIEIGAALARNVRVIPILIDGAVMPESEELPEELRPLAFRQAFAMNSRRWQSDVAQLLQVIDPHAAEPCLISSPSRVWRYEPSSSEKHAFWLDAGAVRSLTPLYDGRTPGESLGEGLITGDIPFTTYPA